MMKAGTEVVKERSSQISPSDPVRGGLSSLFHISASRSRNVNTAHGVIAANSFSMRSARSARALQRAFL
jgi:hypothetical protein